MTVTTRKKYSNKLNKSIHKNYYGVNILQRCYIKRYVKLVTMSSNGFILLDITLCLKYYKCALGCW